ncbi:MAG: peptide ABC transporter substrate-binding protein [Patescibacteria group bacterium]|jgi:peptide/nickel transport system substrate-binding protein
MSVFSAVRSAWESLRRREQRRQAIKDSSLDKRLVLGLSDRRIPSLGQLKHLGRYLDPVERRLLKIFGAAIVIALVAAGTKYYSDHVTRAPAQGGEYTEAAVGGPRFVNPILAGTNDADGDLIKLIFSGLMRTNTKGELVPDLAESYAISEDGKTYTFKLRAGIRWHDGADFSARDIVATYEHVKDPGWDSPYQGQFKNVAVEAPDDQTVVFKLSEPFAPFLGILTLGILPDHLWQEIKPANASRADLNIKPVGTGPFKFNIFIKDKKGAIRSYTLSRNDDYYGEKALLDTLIFKYYPDFASAVEALTGKHVDGISFLPHDALAEVKKFRPVRIYDLRLPQYTAVFFNQAKNAQLGSKAVRQALALAIDRDRIVKEVLGDSGAPIYGPIPPGFVGFHPEVKRYSLDATKAAALLDQEGWKIGEGGLRQKESKDAKTKAVTKTELAITLTTVDSKDSIAVAQIIQQNWASVGVKAELEITPASKIARDKIKTREYEALLYGEIIGPDPDPYPFWHSSQNAAPGLNLAVFSNRRADELLEKSRLTTKEEERATYYKEFQDILAEEVPAIFLYSPTYTYAVSSKIKGIDNGTIFIPADRFSNVINWYINTRRVWK